MAILLLYGAIVHGFAIFNAGSALVLWGRWVWAKACVACAMVREWRKPLGQRRYYFSESDFIAAGIEWAYSVLNERGPEELRRRVIALALNLCLVGGFWLMRAIV